MNGIEKITARITAEAEAEAAAVLAEAEKKAAAVKAEYDKKAGAEYDARMSAGAEETRQRIGRADRAARLDAKKAVLGVKQEMIGAAYAAAKAKILALPEEEYTAFLAKSIGEAALTGDETVILSAADKARLGEKVLEKAGAILQAKGLTPALTLGEAREISGGVVLKKGSVEVNCTVDSLLEMSHNRLDAEVAGILFH